MTDLAARIRALRAERSWSQEHLAGAAGLSLRTVQRVERGDPCAAETLLALASAFGVPSSDLSALAPVAAAPSDRVFGLTSTQAASLGLVLALPSIVYIAGNIAIEEFGWDQGRALPLWLFDNPISILGPLLAGLLNIFHVFRFGVRLNGSAAVIDRLELRFTLAPILVLLTAGACVSILGAYLFVENLGHFVLGYVDR